MPEDIKKTIRIWLSISVLMVVFPPWSVVMRGITSQTGYAFILSLPSFASIDYAKLVLQIIGVGMVTALLFPFLKGGRIKEKLANVENLSLGEGKGGQSHLTEELFSDNEDQGSFAFKIGKLAAIIWGFLKGVVIVVAMAVGIIWALSAIF